MGYSAHGPPNTSHIPLHFHGRKALRVHESRCVAEYLRAPYDEEDYPDARIAAADIPAVDNGNDLMS